MKDMSSGNKKVKVSPTVIKQLKTLGMTKALASVKSNKGNRAYVEGARRMYGAARVNKALGIPTAGSAKRVVNTRVASKLKTMKSDVSKKSVAGGLRSANTKAVSNKVTAKKVVKKSGNFKNGKSFSEFMNTKTKKFGTPN